MVCDAGAKRQPSAHEEGPAIFKVLPVKVWASNPEKPILTYGFIDEGSNVNLCSEKLAKRLGVPLTATNAQLITSNAISVMDQKVKSLAIQGVHESMAFMVKDAFVVEEVVDVSSSIHTALGWTIYGRDVGDKRVFDPPMVMTNFMNSLVVGSGRNNDDSCEQIIELLAQDF